MKQNLFITPVLLLVSLISFSMAGDNYFNLMSESIRLMNESSTLNGLKQSANKFERIALKEEKEWLPYYYAAFCYVKMLYMEESKSQKDQYLDKALKLINKGDSLSPRNSEIYTMKAWIIIEKAMVYPMIRIMTYTDEFYSTIKSAEKINASNPRSYFIHANVSYNMPEMMGGSKDEAIQLYNKSLECFKTFKAESAIHPDWGESGVREKLKEYGISD